MACVSRNINVILGYEKKFKLMLGPALAKSQQAIDEDGAPLSTPRAMRNWNKLRKLVHALLVEGK